MCAGDLRNWMWNEALAMVERAEHLHRRFFEPGLSPIHPASWEPPLDILETDRELLIVVALPGVARSAPPLSVAGRVLGIRAYSGVPGCTHCRRASHVDC